MAVAEANLKLYATTDIPADDVNPGGGAIDLTNEILRDQQGKIYGTVGSNPLAGADKVRYGKAHIYNDHATDDLINGVVWLANGLLDPAVTGTLEFVTEAAGDNNLKYIRSKGRNNAGNPVTEDTTLGAAPGSVFSAGQYLLSHPVRVELRLVADDSIVVSAGDITIKRGITLGIIPEDWSSARGDVEIGLPNVLDDVTVIPDRTTAPGGIVFTRAVDEASGIAIANAGVLTALTDQAVWIEWTLHDGSLPSNNMWINIQPQGDTA